MPLLTLVVMLALHVPHAAEQGRDSRLWYQAYEEGKQAVGKNDVAAIASLEAAKRTGPKPGRNVPTYGDSFVDFNPDYYLGVAYLNQKRFVDAVAAFQRVSDAKLIGPKDKDNAAFVRQASRAMFEMALETGELALASGLFDQALEAARRALGTVGITNAADIRRATDLAEKIEKAKTTAPKTGTTPPANEPRNPPPVNPPVDAKTPALDPKAGPPTGQPVDPGTTKPPAGNTLPGAGAKDPKRGSKVPDTYQRAPTSPPSAAVTAREEPAMTLFFRGDYAGALSLLIDLSTGPGPTARSYFYLACAKAGLLLTGQAGSVLTGQSDAEILQQAKDLFASARGDSDDFSADRQYISPRVLQLLGAKR